MEATPVDRSGPVQLRLATIENHPFRHLIKAAELIRQGRESALLNARIHLEHAGEISLAPYHQEYRRIAAMYVKIARQRNRRLVGVIRDMRGVSP